MQNACSARQTGCNCESTLSNIESSKAPSPCGVHCSLLRRQTGGVIDEIIVSASPFGAVLLPDLLVECAL